MPDFSIVDTHVHLYDPSSISYLWMAGVPQLNSRHASDEYTAAIAPISVDKLVFVEVDAAPGDELKEARWVEQLAKTDTRIAGIVSSIAVDKGASADADLEAFAAMPLARGVRRLIQGHVNEPGWCLRPDFVGGAKKVGRLGLVFEICILHPQMGDAIELIRRCPDVQFVLDHIGKPGIKDAIREPWWTEIETMAALPNVVCKISGAVTEADHNRWTYDQVAPYVGRAIEAFGFDRVMFGGDWPVMELATRYPDWVALVDRVTAGTPVADMRKLYRDNAIRLYRL